MNNTMRGAARASSFDCFIGKWEGLSKTFDADGEPLAETPVHMEMAWSGDNTFTQVENLTSSPR